MATNVLMPKWGMSMREGLVGTWLKKEGDQVEKGEEIVEVESEKAVNLVEAPASGILARILIQEGETVPITTTIAIIADPGEVVPESVAAGSGPDAEPVTEPPAIAPATSAKAAPVSARSRRVAASPAAKRLAREHDVDLSGVAGTGPDGMIVADDVKALQASASTTTTPLSRCAFYSEGHELDGLLYLPKSVPTDRKLPAVAFCLGFTYVKDLLVPDMARRLAERGYAALVFDYRGFGKSEGPRERLFPVEQISDIRSAVTFLAQRPEVDAERIGLVGISLGGSHALSTAAVDPRVRAAAAIAPVGNGSRWLKGTRRHWEWARFLDRVEADRAARVLNGKSERVDAWDIVAPDPDSQSFLDALYREYPDLKCELGLESAEAILEYRPEIVAERIAPRPVLLIHGAEDLLVPVDESRNLFAKCGEPRELVVLPGMSHFDWANPQDCRFDRVMDTLAEWLAIHLPAE